MDPGEFKALMQDLQQRLDFPRDEILLFLAEADMNADGKIEYEVGSGVELSRFLGLKEVEF